MRSKRARRSDDDTDDEDRSTTTATTTITDFSARVGRVALTVEWISRTRGRSNESGEAPACRDATVAVTGATRGRRFIQNCVQLPPNASEDAVTLSWGSLVLAPMERIHGREEGGWSLDVFAETPVRLTLLVPNGTLLRHPALVRETRGKRSVPKVLMSDPDALKTDEVDDEEERPALPPPREVTMNSWRRESSLLAARRRWRRSRVGGSRPAPRSLPAARMPPGAAREPAVGPRPRRARLAATRATRLARTRPRRATSPARAFYPWTR